MLDLRDIDLISVADLVQLAMRAKGWLKAAKGTPPAVGTAEDVFLKGTDDPNMFQYLLTLCRTETRVTFIPALMTRLNPEEARSLIYNYLRSPNRMMEVITKTDPAATQGGGTTDPKKKGVPKETRKTIDPRGTKDDARVKMIELLYDTWKYLSEHGTSEDQAYEQVKENLGKNGLLSHVTTQEKAKKVWDELAETLKKQGPEINSRLFKSLLSKKVTDDIVAKSGDQSHEKLCQAVWATLGGETPEERKAFLADKTREARNSVFFPKSAQTGKVKLSVIVSYSAIAVLVVTLLIWCATFWNG
ncbi:MAG TPA: hypothetical protein VN420_00575 [Candidatus Fimivivens sp.]|nr:hypothetical protein [Candidatus Fimivivens sp.]